MLQPGEDTELTTDDAELDVGPEPVRGCAGPEVVPEQPAHAKITAKAATVRARMTRCYACLPDPRG